MVMSRKSKPDTQSNEFTNMNNRKFRVEVDSCAVTVGQVPATSS